MDRNVLSELDEVFVHDSPVVPQTVRGGVEPLWEQWQNIFNTWMSQAQKVLDVTDSFYACRIGPVVFVTGTIRAGERIEGLYPATTFTDGDVTFSSEGFIRNDGADRSLSVSFISKR